GNYSCISIKNVAFDKECGSNLLSAYCLATQGYRHIQAKTGEYLYFLDSNNRFEWHLRLGHVEKDPLIDILSGGIIDGALRLARKDMTRDNFFCRTCALAKSRRMSYWNMIGTKATVPLHTLHLDSLRKMKPEGLNGTAGFKYTLAVVDDATAHKRYFVMKIAQGGWKRVNKSYDTTGNFSYKDEKSELMEVLIS
ncbi:hypothetical protein PHYSODRAFT_482491, partial [Phytophthora sojae]